MVLVELRWYSDLATGWTVWGVNPARGNGLLSSLKNSDQLCGSLTLMFNGYQGLSPPSKGGEGKGPKHAVEHSPRSSAEVKNEWSYYCAPSVCHHDMERDK